jgi:hypothetical protein
MFSVVKKVINNLSQLSIQLGQISTKQEKLEFEQTEAFSAITDTKILLGKVLTEQNEVKFKTRGYESINDFEFKVFSQFGDDGITQFLINRVQPLNKTFIEFGVQNYDESNTRFLLLNNNWKGLIFDGDAEQMSYVHKQGYYWRHDLTAEPHFITKENINKIISDSDFQGEIGLLHIDLDGNDYWIWNEVDCVSPEILILEYNSVYGKSNAWTVPYNATFNRTAAHFSNLYWGASLKALVMLSSSKGFDFVGCNNAGNNAFFVRKDVIAKKGLEYLVIDVEQGYKESLFRESRDRNNDLTYISGSNRLETIRGCTVYDVIKNENVII